MADDLTIDSLDAEFRHLAEGVKTLADSMANSTDIDELRRFAAMLDEWRTVMYRVPTTATGRLHYLECFARHNALSYVETS